ncbi:anti-sigma regulatory factor (Ser/Thr protein kinase) [Thermocatellispora tengchongensis]|uniref:Anti-sigma regulatory factor (Ser/Thr protein kinase) n=1 Tax=Thermocatellispora tengchongensis TaxID=1073253 RepID=A0A840P956_9ACTN|nr:ATP-binding protein [Thermocatellispora tengchongensis]MBB5133970.1 anti-sigma regulatory factor (Ser/Thr protein kinase) [Thermocatellispora tengchongensis]
MTVTIWEHEGVPTAAREARDFIAKTAPAHPRVDDMVVVVSELVANAVRHTRSGLPPKGKVKVVLTELPAYVRLAVIDDGTVRDEEPRIEDPSPDQESGRGLAVVAALTDRWDHASVGRSRTVWAEWDHDVMDGSASARTTGTGGRGRAGEGAYAGTPRTGTPTPPARAHDSDGRVRVPSSGGGPMSGLTARQEMQLHAIRQTFPAWRICVLGAWWWATRYKPPTEEEKALGVQAMIGRQSAPELVAALTHQLGITSRRRGRIGPTPPLTPAAAPSRAAQ